MLDPKTIRTDFPILSQQRNNQPPRYFDSACMSLRPQQVIDAINDYYTSYGACAGRSSHWFSGETDKAIQNARQIVAKFINSTPGNIIFTHNTTEGINLIARNMQLLGAITIITSDKEHNSNYLPWLRLKQENSINNLIVIPTTADGIIDQEALEAALLKAGTQCFVTFAATSNFDGSTEPLDALISLCKAHDALVHIDGAQYLPHHQLDVTALDIDFLTFSGHKMLGPTGTGALWMKNTFVAQFEPLSIGGGTPFDVTKDSFTYLKGPEKFEGGLQHYAGIAGFGAAITYLTTILKQDPQAITDHQQYLNTIVTNYLLEHQDTVTIHGPQDPAKRPSILSFSVKNMDHHQVGYILDAQANCMVRAGRHCVHAFCNAHNIPGNVRISFYLYNTEEDCEALIETLDKILHLT